MRRGEKEGGNVEDQADELDDSNPVSAGAFPCPEEKIISWKGDGSMVSTVYIISWRYLGCCIVLVLGNGLVDRGCTLLENYQKYRSTGIML